MNSRGSQAPNLAPICIQMRTKRQRCWHNLAPVMPPIQEVAYLRNSTGSLAISVTAPTEWKSSVQFANAHLLLNINQKLIY